MAEVALLGTLISNGLPPPLLLRTVCCADACFVVLDDVDANVAVSVVVEAAAVDVMVEVDVERVELGFTVFEEALVFDFDVVVVVVVVVEAAAALLDEVEIEVAVLLATLPPPDVAAAALVVPAALAALPHRSCTPLPKNKCPIRLLPSACCPLHACCTCVCNVFRSVTHCEEQKPVPPMPAKSVLEQDEMVLE